LFFFFLLCFWVFFFGVFFFWFSFFFFFFSASFFFFFFFLFFFCGVLFLLFVVQLLPFVKGLPAGIDRRTGRASATHLIFPLYRKSLENLALQTSEMHFCASLFSFFFQMSVPCVISTPSRILRGRMRALPPPLSWVKPHYGESWPSLPSPVVVTSLRSLYCLFFP